MFLAIAGITVGILLWAHHHSIDGDMRGLTLIFYVLFFFLDEQAASWMLLAVLCAIWLPERVTGRGLLRWISDHIFIIAAAACVLLCAGSLLVYQNHPVAMDEYAQFFQSQVFAGGHLTGHFPLPLLDWLIPTNFQNYFLTVSRETGAVASRYWPSFALLLTPFTWLGIPWACNPVISALTLLVIRRLALRVFGDPESAGLAVLLTVASPVFFANGISYYSMSAHMLANAVYALLLIQPTVRSALLAGLVGSVALTLHNPVPHMLFALPWVVWLATRPGGWRLLISLLAGYIPLVLVLGLGWFWFSTGLTPASTQAGGHSPALQLLSAFSLPSSDTMFARWIGLAKIWLWAAPGLLILTAVGARNYRHNTACRLLLASAVLTFFGYFLVLFDQGHGWGYRYFHGAWVALPILGAGALSQTSNGNAPIRMFVDDATRAFVVACAVASLVISVGFRVVQIHGFVSDDLAQVPAYTGTERRVVIIDPSFAFYGADLVQNDPWLRGNVIRLITHGQAEDERLLRKHFPDLHRVYQDRYGAVWSAAPVPPPATVH